jgi:hypothetical protein
MESLQKKKLYAPCGLYCGACGEPGCIGCVDGNELDWIKTCEFRICARDRGIDLCCFCDEFPCDPLDRFMHDPWPHHNSIRGNFDFILEHGVDKWLEAQNEEWSCDVCGGEIRWYQKKCSCGNEIDGWDLPEEE